MTYTHMYMHHNTDWHALQPDMFSLIVLHIFRQWALDQGHLEANIYEYSEQPETEAVKTS